jgi:spore coat protein H
MLDRPWRVSAFSLLARVGVSALLTAACSSPTSNHDAKPTVDRPNWGDVVIPEVAKEQIGNNVFDETQVQSYYLTFSDEEYARLMDFSTLLVSSYSVNEDRYVEAALRVGDTELPSIAVRFKGNYSIWGCVDQVTHQRVKRVEPFFGNIDVCQRFSLKLDFDRFDEHFRLDGLKKVNLHAMAADPSKMRERLGYSLFREMGIPAPRAVHARVYINGEYQGVFAVVEEVDGRFTANRFPDSGDGNLYRDVWPSARTTEKDAKEALRTNDDPGSIDVSDFMNFKNAVVASTDANFATKMAPYLDFDQLARYIVVDRGINNFDGSMTFYFGSGWGPFNGNHFWYDVGGGRFILIPWDFDKILWYPEPYFWSDNAPHSNGPVPNWNVVTKDCRGETTNFDMVTVRNGVRQDGECQIQEIDCDPLFKRLRTQIYDRQLAIAQAFVAGPFSEASVTAKLDAWRAQIAEAIAEDPLVDSAHWQTWVGNLRADLPKLHGNLLLMMSGLISE